jgi:hypothetical protein
VASEIIGREEELAELRRFLDAVDRVPAAFLMEGEPGIGKTVLWTAGTATAGCTRAAGRACGRTAGAFKSSSARGAPLRRAPRRAGVVIH